MRKPIIEEEKGFVEKVAKECIAEMSDDMRIHFIGNPNPYSFHFGYGMYIRNKYIHGKKLNFFYLHPDDLSHKIIVKIIELVNQSAKS